VTRIAYVDPVGGLAGDMLIAALLDAGAPRSALEDATAALGLDVRIEVERVQRGGVSATHVDVHASPRTHERPARDLLDIVTEAPLSSTVRARSLDAISRMAASEGAVHGVAADAVVLHELGGDDTLVDICGTFALLEALGVERVVCAPLPMGRGVIASSHGSLPSPAPSTLALLRGVPVIGAQTPGELVTPTGAAIITTIADGFGAMPPMVLDGVGTGAGSREHADRPNIVRVMFGDAITTGTPGRGEVVVLEANVDDLVPELVPDVLDACRAAGAIDSWTTPVQMKKGRPGVIVSVLARPEDERVVAEALLRHSTTLGVRVQRLGRYALDRAIREVQVAGRTVRVKIGLLDGGVVNVAPEHDDCAIVAAATGRPVKQIWAEALAAATAAHGAGAPTEQVDDVAR
jgi:hypothetical protein